MDKAYRKMKHHSRMQEIYMTLGKIPLLRQWADRKFIQHMEGFVYAMDECCKELHMPTPDIVNIVEDKVSTVLIRES